MKDTFLEKIIAVTREKVEAQKQEASIGATRKRALTIRPSVEPFRLSQALGRKDRTNVVAEIKRASPSKGVINDQIDVCETAKMYERGGACAISVLTEEQFFRGSIEDLKIARDSVELPILRKDFTIDEFQIYEAAAAGADAVLLIVAALTFENLRDFQTLARELELDALVEVHTLSELEIAIEVGAKLIGVNNRNLRTFDVSIDVSRELIKYRPTNVLMIAESGISSRQEIEELHSLGFDGFLVGESLMRSDAAQQTLEAMI
jgi:indole-3-glycerol phosphate synthase